MLFAYAGYGVVAMLVIAMSVFVIIGTIQFIMEFFEDITKGECVSILIVLTVVGAIVGAVIYVITLVMGA